jgi:hypothetical protein
VAVGGRSLVASPVAACRAHAVRRRRAGARRRAAQDAATRTGGDDASDPRHGAGAGGGADVSELPHPHRLRPARVRVHPPANRALADLDGVLRGVRHRQQCRVRAALGHVRPLSLLLALGAERRGHLAGGAVLLDHLLAGPERGRGLGAGRRRDSGYRRLCAGGDYTSGRLAVHHQRACLSGLRARPPCADLRRRHDDRAARRRPGPVAVPALDARLGGGRGRPLRPHSRSAAGLSLLPRRVPGGAAGRAHQPRAGRAGGLRVAHGAAAAAARGKRAAGARLVPGDLLPRAARLRAARPDLRRGIRWCSGGTPSAR